MALNLIEEKTSFDGKKFIFVPLFFVLPICFNGFNVLPFLKITEFSCIFEDFWRFEDLGGFFDQSHKKIGTLPKSAKILPTSPKIQNFEISFVFVLVLFCFFGHFGIALATSIVAYFVLFVLFIILFKKKRLSVEVFKPLFVIIILILPFTIALIFGYNLINNINLNIYLSLILLFFLASAIWFFLVYICGLVKFN